MSLPLALFGVSGCRSERSAKPCPARFALDAPRATRLLETLGKVERGARIRDEALATGPLEICFGALAVSSVTTTGIVLMDETLGDEEAASRLGHLLTHVSQGLSRFEGDAGADGGCDAWVARALDAEATALSLEIELRRALGVTSPRSKYAFEDDVRAAKEEDREAIVLAYLRAHPDGGPGIDALASGYARRCR